MTDQLIWITLGIVAAIVSSGIPLVQEKHKGNPFAVAIWVKIGVALLTLPFVAFLITRAFISLQG